jgi:hypothetical protein
VAKGSKIPMGRKSMSIICPSKLTSMFLGFIVC